MTNKNPNYKYQKKQQRTVLEVIVVGIFKALWWLVKLPFKKGKGRSQISQTDRNNVILQRQEIEKLLDSENEIELKHAVMESDKLVDQVLKLKKYQGETFADRLRSAENNIDRVLYDQIWQGHKVRNMLAHENGVRISNQELKSAAGKLLNYAKQI